ncbi:MAG: hypothetical protein ABIH67_01235 [Candidatus Uhrbacteria bacterium]
MEHHMQSRPKRTPFDKEEQLRLRNLAIIKIKNKLLSDKGVQKIVLIGSSIKGFFGKYEPPGFRGSLFSDFDFIIFVTDDYKIPDWLDREPDGKPFPNDEMNLAYRKKNFVEDKYDAEIFFIRESNARNIKIQKLGEEAGIPMTDISEHKHLVVYS